MALGKPRHAEQKHNQNNISQVISRNAHPRLTTSQQIRESRLPRNDGL